MNGDLSLSRALGGLRIANPDDSPSAIPSTPSSLPTNAAEPIETVDRKDHDSSPNFPLHPPDSARLRQDIAPSQRPLPDLGQPQELDEATATTTGRPGQLDLLQPASPSKVPDSATGRGPDTNRTRQPFRDSAGGERSSESAGTVPSGDVSYSKRLSRTSSHNGPAFSNTGLARGHSRGSQVRRVSRQAPIPASGEPLIPRRGSRGLGGGGYGLTHSSSTGPTGPTGTAGPQYGPEDPLPTSSEEWEHRGAAVSVRKELTASGRTVVRHVKKGVRDFAFGRILGEGSYSTVYLATDRQTLKEYAIKVLDKKHIIKEKKIKYVNIEKDTLNMLTEHPGIVRLYYTFQDENSLYYVLDLCNGGELLGVLKKTGSFDEECTRFYGAQILDAVEYMHSRGVIHRDLKPENVLLDDQMHLKITDFGTAKKMKDSRARSGAPAGGTAGDRDRDRDRSASFVGTAEYVSPELLTNKTAGKASDLWAFGCILYQLLTGRPPFKGGTEYLTFQKIVALDYEFPSGFPPAARDLIERCLVLDPARRLTVEHIKNHQFFDGHRFGKVLWQMKAPRLRPYDPQAKPALATTPGMFAALPQQQQQQQQQQQPFPNPRSRIITEQPPTQLDIDWSPVLTRTNERILKLGDLMVISSPLPLSPHGKGPDHVEGHKKLARFFGGSTTKKRQRLVIVTSSGRIVMAPSGGEEKRVKQEISLLGQDCSWRSQLDVKGQLVWCVDSAGVHYTFEEPKSSSSSLEPPVSSAGDWIEVLEKAKNLAMSQNLVGSYNSDGGYAEAPSGVPSPASTLGGRVNFPEGSNGSDRLGRSLLIKNQAAPEDAKRNIFSKRQSKNGLGPAF